MRDWVTWAQKLEAAEAVCFSDPWHMQTLISFLEQNTSVFFYWQEGLRIGKISELDFLLDVEITNEVQDFTGYLLAQDCGEEIEILRFALLPENRRKGQGRAFLKAFLDFWKEKGKNQILLEVREGNQKARQLYKSLGFVCVHKRLNYYPDNRETACLYNCDLID